MVLQILEMCFWTSATCVEGCVDWMNVLGVWANCIFGQFFPTFYANEGL
jgi:hypothetical protein